jgi:3-methyl-2-oxobutanoate hydroxymethyltransferase
MDEMISHAQAVHRGAPNTFCVGDMPFMSYQLSDEEAILNAGRFIKEAAMDAIKLEGYTPSCLSRISAINDAGMVVIGHIGLTPQFAAQLGGNKAQGKSLEAAVKLVKAAKDIEAAGASMILVEGVPAITGKAIHDAVSIPVLGIGAGSYMDGQLLIFADMVGYYDDFTPKFVKKYGNVGEVMLKSFQDYCAEVKAGEFPIDGVHAYKIKEEEAKAIEEAIAAEFK